MTSIPQLTKETGLPLNPMQLRFAQEYMLDPSSGSKAALRAGYSPDSSRQAAVRLLADPRIKKIIQDEQNRVIETTGVTKDRILQELMKIAFADPSATITVDEDGEPVINPHGLSSAESAGLEVAINTTGSKDKKVKSVSVRTIKPADRISALEKLGKHLGIFVDRHQIEEAVRVVITEEEA